MACFTSKCLQAAKEISHLSHSPYGSDSAVGVAVYSDKGIVCGCTLDNCAYPNSICGIRAALCAAVSEGTTKINKIAVVGTSQAHRPYICGACREFMAEFGNYEVVISSSDISKSETTTVLDLLPGRYFASDYIKGRKFELTEEETTDFIPLPSVNQPKEVMELHQRAIAACKNVYTPVSHFPVGAAVLTDKGVFSGSNIEAKIIGLGLCAERVALCKAVAGGATQIKAISITCYKMDDFGSPCGGCRQNLVEFENFPVYLLKLNKANKTFDVQPTTSFKLLPDAFTPASLI